MKSNKLLLAIAFLSISTTFAQKSNIEKDIKMYTQVWEDIVNKGEIEKINDTHFDKNIVMVTKPENIVGINAFKAYYQNFITGFSDRKFTVKNIFGKGDQLVKYWQFTGKHTGDFFGIPATGKTVSIEGATIAKMENGKVAQEQDFMDNGILMQQLGLTPDPINTAIVDGLYNAFAAGDIPTVLGAMDANIVWNEASSSSYSDGNPYTSPEAVLNGVFKRIGEDNDYFKLENIKLTALGDNKVLASLNYNYKSKKTGETNKPSVVHEWTIENGKIIAFQQYLGLGKQ